MYFNNCFEGKFSESLFDTAHKTPSAQQVETLKLQLSTCNIFFTVETQNNACECLMLLVEIMGKGFGLCLTNDNIYSKGSSSDSDCHCFRKIHYMWRMYSEISGFWNHQSVIYHLNWLYLHAGIIDAGAQKNVQDLFLLWKGHLAYRIKTNFTTS